MERQGLEYLTRSFQKLYLTLTSTDSYQTVSYPKTLMHGQESSRAEKRDLMTGDQRANKLFEQFFTMTYRYLNRFCKRRGYYPNEAKPIDAILMDTNH